MTPRALLLALVLAVATGLLVQQVALVYNAGEIESSVPPVPAVFSLLLLAAVNPVLERLRPRWALRRGEILMVYCALVLTVAMSGRRMARCLLGFMMAPQYYERLRDVGESIPSWVVPKDPEVVRQFFETSPTGRVPWGAWATPLAAWTAFLIISWLGLFCLISLFERRWAEQEHLRFPLLFLPLEMTGEPTATRRQFFRNPVMWIGFAAGFWYALPVVLTPVWPGIPQWKVTLYPFQGLTALPWSELRGVYFRPLPHLIGLGYLMSSDNLLTVWAVYHLQKLFWVAATAMGVRRPGWHIGIEHQQATGAILVLALWLLWSHRRALAQMIRSVGESSGQQAAGRIAPRFLILGAVVGFAFAVCWAHAAGVPWSMALCLFGVIFASGLVYARIRSETGLPSYWALPFVFEERNLLLDVFGWRTVMRTGGLPALAAFSHFGWMTTGQYTQTGAYHIENLRLGQIAGESEWRMFGLSLGAAALGLGIAYWTHLNTFYSIGALSAVGAGGNGYYEVNWASGSYTQLVNLAPRDALGPNILRLAGAAIVLVLALLRGRFTWFPLTPWGYVIASSYGNTYWASFFLTWAAQRIILRYGGMTLHAKAVPAFLGIAFGYMAATLAAVAMGFATGQVFSFAAGRRLFFDV